MSCGSQKGHCFELLSYDRLQQHTPFCHNLFLNVSKNLATEYILQCQKTIICLRRLLQKCVFKSVIIYYK